MSAFSSIAKIPELKRRIIFTLLMLAVYRLGCQIPTPGIDADALCASRSGLIWMTITGYGATGQAADWIGFGDDCAVAAGLAEALRRAAGHPGFVGDAIADPLTGIHAALGIAKLAITVTATTREAFEQSAAAART